MMLVWYDGKSSVGAPILLDAMFPWPALHHGRLAMKAVAHKQGLRMKRRGGPGWVRWQWPQQTAVCEYGDATLRIWPVDTQGGPRVWGEDDPRDRHWRDVIDGFKAEIEAEIACDIRVEWMPGHGPVERFTTEAQIAEQPGFYGWQRGEHQPRGRGL